FILIIAGHPDLAEIKSHMGPGAYEDDRFLFSQKQIHILIFEIFIMVDLRKISFNGDELTYTFDLIHKNDRLFIGPLLAFILVKPCKNEIGDHSTYCKSYK